MNLSDIAIRRPVFTVMVMAAMMILGLVAFSRLGVDLFPDISFPLVTVSTPYPGAGPEDVEKEVTRPIEDAVSSIAGLDSVRSYSREGVSIVIVAFDIGTDTDRAALEVREKVAVARHSMPTDVMESSFLRVDPSAAPVMTLVVAAPGDPRRVQDLADDVVRPALEKADGVAVVNVRGGAEREIQVDASASKLAAFGLSISQVSQALRTENLDVPTGRMEEGANELALRVSGEIGSVQEIEEIVVGSAGGAPVRVRDVATVTDGVAERRTLVRVNGAEAVAIEVLKQSGGNTVAVADEVYGAIEEARRQLPPDAKLDIVSDTSIFIRENATDVEHSIVLGGLAAIAIIFLFMLDWRSTVISALALPTSVVSTFFFMYVMGFTLNMMSLMALSLAIGFLIDDAIVVRENIFRHIEAGESPMEAASKGTREIALAVLATTATILAVFVPVAFTGGMIGQMFQQFGLTVSAAVVVSLFVSFTLDPMLSARWVQARHGHHADSGVVAFVRARLDALDRLYRGVLEWSLGHQKTVVGLALLTFFSSFSVLAVTGTDFFPKPDRGQTTVLVTMPAGTSLAATTAVVAEVERILTADKDVLLVYSTVGVNEEARKASVRVNATQKTERDRSQAEMMADIREQLAHIPGARFSIQVAGIIEGEADFRQSPVTINVRGADFAVLLPIAEQVGAIVERTRGITDQDSTWAPGQPELRARIDRDAASAIGLSAAQAGLLIRSAIVGETPTRLRDGEDDIDIRVRLQPSDRSDRTAFESLLIPTRGGLAPLRQVVTVERGSGPSTIEREDRQRQITVTANVAGRALGDVVNEIEAEMQGIDVPPGYTVKFAGEAERMRESMAALGVALLLAVVFIYVVLASQFESFVHPVTIMVSLPLAIVGALLGLFLSGYTIGMSSFIGIILLMGLVTKNAILLVDLANVLRDEQGLSIRDALLVAGPQRLRPIVMTSVAMVIGMMPTALSNGPGSEFRAPMAIAVIGGVITSTVLTLVVVPVAYTWLDRLTGRHRKARPVEVAPSPSGDDEELPIAAGERT